MPDEKINEDVAKAARADEERNRELAAKRAAELKDAAKASQEESKDVISTTAKLQPTPTQAENDLYAAGGHTLEDLDDKEDHGAPPEAPSVGPRKATAGAKNRSVSTSD